MTASADHAYPPLHLANRVCCLDGRGDPIRAYEELRAEAKRFLLNLLPHDWSFADKRVLDFGCGGGRTLRHFLAEARQGEVWGSGWSTGRSTSPGRCRSSRI